jgi:hypothetical protein
MATAKNKSSQSTKPRKSPTDPFTEDEFEEMYEDQRRAREREDDEISKEIEKGLGPKPKKK